MEQLDFTSSNIEANSTSQISDESTATSGTSHLPRLRDRATDHSVSMERLFDVLQPSAVIF